MLEVLKVLTADLEIGMYVSSLDRPWLETPFVLQGFQLESDKDIERLRKHCDYVYIDTQQSNLEESTIRRKVSYRPRMTNQQLFPQRTLKTYKDNADWKDEYPKAQNAVKVLSKSLDDIFANVGQGAGLNMAKVKLAVEPMIDSITRNPDACIWLARMKQEDQYTYQHSLGASIWAVALGRQLGLPKSDLRSLAIGGLLFDVGKLQLDKELLNADRGLTEEEFVAVKAHVGLGVDAIQKSGVMNKDIIDMVSYHHERHDGSGYPEGLSGDSIPIFARIAAIVDCYDAITSHRSYARATSPSIAIKKLYEWKDIDFQAELVEEFIQAVGIYPAGTLVELSSGEVAVVIAEYRTRRLRPKLMVLLGADKQPLSDVKMIDLLIQKETEDGKPLDIVSSLEPEAYGIDMTAIQL
ncbi:MAG: HD-GYP domain-containing protein [Proteobacteria bacterium]|nr:HD-GYP domain-containing protein [Pseudomonadota bacterium]